MTDEIKIEKMTIEENQAFADAVLMPILMIIDSAINTWDISRLRETYNAMLNKQSYSAAFPFQETMDKADELAAKNHLFDAILILMERRIKLREALVELANKPRGVDLLRDLGL